MANEIDIWKVKQFGANVYHTAQQKGSKFEGFCRSETINGTAKFLDILGPTSAQDRTTRNPDTPNVQMFHNRRMITMADKDWGTLVDDMDKLRMIHMPESEYLTAAVNAFGRKKDDMFVSAFTAPAYEDVGGGTAVAYPFARQSIAAVNTAGNALDNLNMRTLRLAKQLFDESDIDPDLQRYLLVGPSQIQNLLTDTTVTSADYNNVKALVDGKIDTYMGFKFVMSNRLLKSIQVASTDQKFTLSTGVYAAGGTIVGATNRQCLAFCGDAMIRGIGQDVTTEIAKRADKSFSNQIYIKMSLGFMRMEDVKTLVINCKE
jgi:hypothetical protein